MECKEITVQLAIQEADGTSSLLEVVVICSLMFTFRAGTKTDKLGKI